MSVQLLKEPHIEQTPTLQAGLEHHQAGRLAEAETIYRQILAVTPNQADALHLLGILANQTGHHQAACELIGQSLALAPSAARYLHLGQGLQGVGQAEAAIENYEKALVIQSDLAEAYFSLADAFGRQEKFDLVLASYKRLLAVQPAQADAHYNMGVVYQNNMQLDSAVQSYRAAVAIKPDFVAAFINMGQALLTLGRLEEAAESNRQALNLVPDFAEVHSNLGLVLRAQGHLDAAAESFCKSIALKPDFADAHNNLGDVYRDQAQFALAVESYGRALALRPDFVEVHNNLGLALQAQDKLDAALASFQQAIQCKPDFTVAFYNMGLLLQKQNKHEEANTCFHRAIALDHGYAQAIFSLGDILHGEGKLEEALEYYRKALALKPDYADAHYNMGVVLHSQKKLTRAIACYRQAIAACPSYFDAYINIGNALQAQGKTKEALEQFRNILLLKPDFSEAHSNIIFSLDMACDLDMAGLQQERRRWDEMHGAPFVTLQRPHNNRIDPQRRLRIGYVSADFRIHSAAFVFGAMLSHYDSEQFEVFAYSNTQLEDRQTEQFSSSVSCWRKIVGMSDDAVAQLIREDEIDILVDLSGHSAGNRLLVFARKPAPIQITAWGYALSTGMQAVDVFFADSVVVPPEEKALFTEEVVYLPSVVGSFFPNAFPDVRALPALMPDADGITFGSFNRLVKISESAFKVWSQVLHATPNSRLLLKTAELDGQDARDRVLGYFENEGIDPTRIVLKGGSSWEAHVADFEKIDIALDPFPHGGGVTTIEGIMMGVPVVTLRWHTIAGRLSASILTTLELNDWIAETPEQYVQIALKKASELNELAALRKQLRGKFTSSIIGDTKSYVAVVECEYRRLWQRWCARQNVTGERSAPLVSTIVEQVF